MNVINKKINVWNGESIDFVFLAFNLISQCTAAEIEVIFRNLSLIEQRNNFIISFFLAFLRLGINCYSADYHQRNEDIG